MTELKVWQLFNRFDEYFDYIEYLDLTKHISKRTIEDDSDAPNLQRMHDDFICQYGNWFVEHWSYSHHDNIIYLEIRKPYYLEVQEHK